MSNATIKTIRASRTNAGGCYSRVHPGMFVHLGFNKMPACIKCKKVKPSRHFRLVKGYVYNKPELNHVCIECERPPLVKCAYCGKPLYYSLIYRVSKKLHECVQCHENTLAIIEKNIILNIISTINQSIKKTNRMSVHLIGNLRDTLFETINGLKTGTIMDRTLSDMKMNGIKIKA